MTTTKKDRGQFYTTNYEYILSSIKLDENIEYIEPFAGDGMLIEWLNKNNISSIIAYDIEPKHTSVIERDTLLDPPLYENKYIITNPPYLARNKTKGKFVFDKYKTNDLYKCFILSILEQQNKCLGGIIIIPLTFFSMVRVNDKKIRDRFMANFKLELVRFFEEPVFVDTPTTVVVIKFEYSEEILTEQNVIWENGTTGNKQIFNMTAENDWVIGGHIYKLNKRECIFKRYTSNYKLQGNEYQTFITLNALDSGTENGTIKLTYKHNYIYPAKETSRTFATLISINNELTEDIQIKLCSEFNKFITEERERYWSLFLPQYRESKDYARKRIPFDLVYNLLTYLFNKSKSIS